MTKLINMIASKSENFAYCQRYLLQIDSNNAKMPIIKQHPSAIITDFVSKNKNKESLSHKSFINYHMLCYYGDENVNKVKGRCIILH